MAMTKEEAFVHYSPEDFFVVKPVRRYELAAGPRLFGHPGPNLLRLPDKFSSVELDSWEDTLDELFARVFG